MTAAANATDARSCRWDTCRRKHFRFRQKYRMSPQASAEDWYPILPSAASAAEQMCSHMRQRAFVDVSTLSTFTNASTTHLCAFRRVHRNVLVCTSLLRCLCHLLLRSSANGGQREGRGEELAVTPVPRTSSGLIRRIWQLKLDVCTLSASSNS